MNKGMEKGGKQAYYVLVLLCLAYLFDYADRMVMSSLLPFIKVEWNISDENLGYLTGIVSLFIALFVLPTSVLIDRWSRKKMVAIMILLWSFSTLLCAFAKDYNHLLWARALTGLGEAGYSSASIAMIATAFPLNSRAKIMGIWDAFAPLGAGIGFMVGGYIGLHYGWRHALGLLALPGIILSVLFWFSKDYETFSLSDKGNKDKISFKGFGDKLKELFKTKTLWLVYLGFAMNLGVNTSIMTWIPSYFHREFDVDEKKAGLLAGTVAVLALLGSPLGGWIADKWRNNNPDSRIMVPFFSSLLSSALLFLALISKDFSFALVYFFGFGVFTVGFLAPASAVIQDVVHPGMRAFAFGINVVLMNILGAFWAPVIVGKVSDITGLHRALFLLPIMAIVGAVFFVLSKQHYQGDCKKELG